MKTKKKISGSVLATLILFLGISCGKGNGYGYSNPANNGNNNNTAYDIVMSNMTFSPSSKTVTKGTVVTWKNNDGYAHTVTSNDGTSFNSGNINAGGTFSYTANTVGTFDYHCTIHPGMTGTLIVTQ